MEAKLLAHLQTRPIAQIALNSRENQDLQALKLMVVIDHQIAKKNMYSEMAKQPKLLQHLMTFYSFKNFQYFKYDIAKHFVGEKVLQCRNCELIAPYAVIQTHSAITHNLHLSGKKCAWCNELDLKLMLVIAQSNNATKTIWKEMQSQILHIQQLLIISTTYCDRLQLDLV